MTFTLTGEPKSTQHIYGLRRGGGVFMKPEGKNLKTAYQWEAKGQAIREGYKPLKGNVDVSLRFFFCTARKRDVDNFNKLVLDALSGIAYTDDSQITDFHVQHRLDRACPRVEVTVQPV